MSSADTQLERISQLIFGLSRQLKELMQAHHPASLSMLHLGTLHYVGEQGQPLMSDIAKHLCITRPSATSLINGLVKSGHLRRLHDTQDRRSVRLALTAQGSKTLAQGFSQMNKQLHNVLKILSPLEQKQMIMILIKLTKRIQE